MGFFVRVCFVVELCDRVVIVGLNDGWYWG